jgi:hypothetical protein
MQGNEEFNRTTAFREMSISCMNITQLVLLLLKCYISLPNHLKSTKVKFVPSTFKHEFVRLRDWLIMITIMHLIKIAFSKRLIRLINASMCKNSHHVSHICI